MIALFILAVVLAVFVFSARAKMSQYNQPNKSLWQEVDGVKILDPNAVGDGFMVRLA